MKLYIKERVFSWGDQFTVKDASGRDKYLVRGEIFSWGKKLHVYNMAGEEVAFIRQELLNLLPCYSVFCADRQVAQIRRELSFFVPRYRIDGLGWQVEGSFLAHDYRITCAGRPIVSICKEWMTWGDSYELNIADPGQELVALAVVLTIDCVDEANSRSSN